MIRKRFLKLIIPIITICIWGCTKDDIITDNLDFIPFESSSPTKNSDSTGTSTPSLAINILQTDILATSEDNILKLVDGNLMMSNDLGTTWKSLKNTIGIISYVHWFKDGSCLICGRSKAYWVDKTFSRLEESVVYDYDGRIINDSSPHFYITLHGHENHFELDGKETHIWPDYFGEKDGFISRIWQTTDKGKTIHCICKNKETKDDENRLISCRHFHDCLLRKGTNELYITSGDSNNQCQLIRGTYTEGSWSFHIINSGKLFKFDGINIEEPYIYFVCDYTGYGQTGLLKVDFKDIENIDNYEYVYTSPTNEPMTKSYDYGYYKMISYDGSVKSKILLSYNGSPYSDKIILFDGKEGTISYLSNCNNDGLILLRRGDGYNISDLQLNNHMYNLTEGMKNAGFNTTILKK